MRKKLCQVTLLLAVTASMLACAPVDRGVPMGGRDYDGKPPYNVGCDPNGVKMFQPDSCK